MYAHAADMQPAEGDEISAILTESIESNSKKDDILLEDAAWADSCLISDSQVSDGSWDALRAALFESLTARAAHNDQEPSEEACAMEIAEPGEVACSDGGEEGEDSVEGLLGSQEREIESMDNVFKLWALETMEEEEENELIKQLKKAFAETKFECRQQLPAATKFKCSQLQPADVNELITDMGDLSLESLSDHSEGSM